ncbi:MAG: LrgB family protein [Acidaminococcaceae bacterium]|jgi:predicted murein hydrolase (TIGR00659 family)|nr:LrgB family protein [Acidaminococcaceae bacterium]MCI2109825.1 LrgB family protein [Acidaminococcaceae bacterium]
MPKTLLNSPLTGIALTLLTFYLGEVLAKKLKTSLLPPFLTSTVLIIILLLCQDKFTYKEYEIGGKFLAMFLGPATIALGLPLVKNLELLKKNLKALLGATVIGTCAGVGSAYGFSKLFGVSKEITLSLLPKSITTPIAMEVSADIGGIPAITIAAVAVTGVVGAVFAHKILKVLGVTNDIAIGFAIGTSSHALGTSSCIPISLTQVAFSSLAISFIGVATAILAPIVAMFMQ